MSSPRHFPLIGSLLAVLGCTPVEEPPGQSATPVTTFEILASMKLDEDRYSANVDPYSQVRVSSQVDGAVVEIPKIVGADGADRELQGGDAVEADQLLAKVETDVYQEKVDKAEAELADQAASMVASKDEYDRYVSAGDAVAKSKVENTLALWQSAQAKVARAQHSLDMAKIDLNRTSITAPSAGLLLSRNVEVGDIVSKGSLIYQLADVTKMKVVFGVPASIAAVLSEGTLLHLVVGALDSREYAGPITRISPAADPQSRIFDIELTVENSDGALKVGMIATLKLSASLANGKPPESAVLVPIDAIVRPPGESTGYAVYVTDGGAGSGTNELKVAMRKVTVGDVLGADLIVLDGLKPGDAVVVRGSTIVSDGATVRVIQ